MSVGSFKRHSIPQLDGFAVTLQPLRLEFTAIPTHSQFI